MRVLIYSHDTYGLGHIRRSLLLADALAHAPSRPQVLIATGSPRAQAFRLPAGCDTVKLPSVLKQPDGSYGTRTLGTSIGETLRLRSELITSAARAFHPDRILVDHAPLGLLGELEPLFDELATWRRRPRVTLGLRDIIDDANVVQRDWDTNGVWSRLDATYDDILVYGDRRVLTTAEELDLPRRYGRKVYFSGYLGRGRLRGMPRRPGRRILVTAGGGGDGAMLIEGFARALEEGRVPEARIRVVTGPFLSPRRIARFKRRFREIEERRAASAFRLKVTTFNKRLQKHLAEADAVISMAGYNSVMEILSAETPALLIPRETPRREQRIRADRLGPRCGIAVHRSGDDVGVAIGNFIADTFAGKRTVRACVEMNGVARTVHRLLDERTHETTKRAQ